MNLTEGPLFPVPQHPKACEPCCLDCGDRDCRTDLGSLYCAGCTPDHRVVNENHNQ